MANKTAWFNNDIMVPILTTDVQCTSLTCDGPMTCTQLVLNSVNVASGTIGTLTSTN